MEGSQTSTDRKPLYDMFTAVPDRYDPMNRLMTWGMDVRWRREAARLCLDSSPRRVLDLCCGTGDLAFELSRQSQGSTCITAVDFSQPMLDLAFRKAARAEFNLTLVRGDAAQLPFADRAFDAVGIAFAFRNLTWKNPHRAEHIAEMARVLAPGGRLVIVESSQPASAVVRLGFRSYLRWFIGGAGAALSGTPGAYRYLAQSAAQFYTPAEIELMLRDAGFQRVEYRPMLLGAVGIHVATR
jgi:demethylmenaquinone methyltransferase / 2-methoxy-6-polyprenyl-1,4-benzoquinol methylase